MGIQIKVKPKKKKRKKEKFMRLCIYILMFQINVKSEIHFYIVFFIEKMIKRF